MEAVSPKTKVRFTETGQFSVDFEMIYTCRVHSKQCAPEILLTLICPFFPSHRKKGAGRGSGLLGNFQAGKNSCMHPKNLWNESRARRAKINRTSAFYSPGPVSDIKQIYIFTHKLMPTKKTLCTTFFQVLVSASRYINHSWVWCMLIRLIEYSS